LNPFALLGLALALGLRHAADPDHVVAVTAITARTKRVLPAMWLGVVWGLGHTVTLFTVGAAIILFHLVVPPRVGLTLELAVGLALVVVGLLNLKSPAGDGSSGLPGEGKRERIPAWRAFFVGLIHGLAGSAAVALLVLATVRDPRWACAYLLVFGFGTLAGMSLVTTGLAAPLTAASQRWPRFSRGARLVTGLLSLVFGVWLVYQIGWKDGLFLASPHWSPH
jgi:high-affinity nickel-transport protein